MSSATAIAARAAMPHALSSSTHYWQARERSPQRPPLITPSGAASYAVCAVLRAPAIDDCSSDNRGSVQPPTERRLSGRGERRRRHSRPHAHT